MRALLSVRCGGPETLELHEVPDPVAGPEELLIRVESCGVNYPDVLIIEDRYQARPERPFSPGSEVFGIVEGTGPDVSGFSPGDRVAALAFVGGMAELVTCPATLAYRVPSDIPGAIAAMLLSTYSTAYLALVERGRLQSGERVLVLGAAGGVGSAAVEIARCMKAHVIGAVSSEAKAKAAIASGAHSCIIYPEALDGFAFGREAPDLILDPVGGAFAEPALRALAQGGRYLVVGFAAGVSEASLDTVLSKECDIIGISLGGLAKRSPERFRRSVTALTELYRQGRITPRIAETFPLAQGAEAIAMLRERRVVGKVIVAIGTGAFLGVFS